MTIDREVELDVGGERVDELQPVREVQEGPVLLVERAGAVAGSSRIGVVVDAMAACVANHALHDGIVHVALGAQLLVEGDDAQAAGRPDAVHDVEPEAEERIPLVRSGA